ncbi:hypothetical protein HK105_200681 [Polyrhizophydium stewartii]|uniref:30S ribosomal protein S21 n=1 Tax=Polyrhizophydium stewartii TaxID=2732419 RepID=A0ABR4NJR7_9FUNG|nr:hypothetical protein HK105_007180 [Polyrhizophydium stewartii]
MPQSHGRSVACLKMSPTQAYSKLREILNESNFRALVRGQERFEPNPDKRRRRRKERDWAIYMAEVRKQSYQAVDLRKRTKIERANYKEI